HELAHTSVGRMVCGCWGKRNFNVWNLCGECWAENPLAILATYAGPAYSFLMIWSGFILLSDRFSARIRSIGFALIVSSMPFSRIMTPIFGGGDEVYAFNSTWNNHTLSWIAAGVITFSLTIPPCVRLWNTIGSRRRIWWFLGLIFVPFLMTGLVVFGVLQTLLLGNGVLTDYWAMGSPMLITVWLMVCVGVCLILGRSLTTLLQPLA